MSPTRVLLADDHGIVRKGVRALLESAPEMSVIAEAADGKEAVRLAEELEPDVVIIDVAMPLLNGIEAAARITKTRPATHVIVLSMHSDESYLARALTAGAKGYLVKESAEEVLLEAVETVSRGRPFFSPEISKFLVEEYLRQRAQRGLRDSFDLLTDREKEVLQLLALGRTNKEVAALLDLSVYTVETHRTNLMKKLDLHNTAELVLYAVRRKLVS
ncbi:MAG: response regulator transcription factor [Deltaproteobacteria bacterium]|nr:response regulator transcription factor [Deltaproteobacteria bacterium]